MSTNEHPTHDLATALPPRFGPGIRERIIIPAPVNPIEAMYAAMEQAELELAHQEGEQ